MKRTTAVFVILLIIYINVSSSSKNGKFDATSGSEKSVFKMHKLNLIYGKAQNTLGDSKLKDLMNDLKRHELDEVNLKKIKAHNQDKEGLLEASVRKKLLNILSKYNLEKLYHDIHTVVDDGTKSSKSQDHTQHVHNPELNIRDQVFRDKRLDKLWKKAEKTGFTQEQLMILHEEFQHQQDRIDEHIDIMNLVDIKAHQVDRDSNSFENSIEEAAHLRENDDLPRRKESPAEKKARLDRNLQQTLKDRYSDVKRGYAELHKKVVEGKVNDDDEFQEEAVSKLWKVAKDADFTQEELEDLKEELHHYQTRIKKLRHFEVQLDYDKNAKKDVNSNDDDDEPDVKHMKRRVKELGYKVSELQRSLENRISNRHTEL